MMDNMIERMARAAESWIARHIEADTRANDMQANELAGMMRAVLAAMREPTPAMLDRFVSRALCVRVSGEYTWTEYGRGQWQAMIEAVDADFPTSPGLTNTDSPET